jgi:hypothetical protein
MCGQRPGSLTIGTLYDERRLQTVCLEALSIFSACAVATSQEVGKKSRVKVAEKFVGQKGATREAVEEAIKLWLKS